MTKHQIEEKGILGQWLLSEFGSNDYTVIAQTIADKILHLAKQDKPPVNPLALLKIRGVKSVHFCDIETSGRLRILDNNFIIDVRDGPMVRTRFTLAHEIGHTVLYDIKRCPPNRLLHGVKTSEEEHFCNLLAASILMPTDMVESQFAQVKKELSPVVITSKMADIFNVSFEAMARRLFALQLFKGVVLCVNWLAGQATRKDVQKEDCTAWRITWTVTSPTLHTLYIPSVSNRPRLRSPLIEEAYQSRSSISAYLDSRNLQIGNLYKALEASKQTPRPPQIWIQPMMPPGIQLDGQQQMSAEYSESLLRSKSAVVIYVLI